MEALSAGLPVVAYDWRGVGTMIDQGENGYVVPVHDVGVFCQAVERVLTENRLDGMRKAARRVFLERFTLDRHIAALLDAFRTLDKRPYKNSRSGGSRHLDGI
jgi:glycosyltransferase involved in cell wall biosynthesis